MQAYHREECNETGFTQGPELTFTDIKKMRMHEKLMEWEISNSGKVPECIDRRGRWEGKADRKAVHRELP